jgi:HSP20 family protein
MTLIKFKNESPANARVRLPYFNDLFNDLFENSITPDFRRSTVPHVNIRENGDRFVLEMAAPGLNKEDFKLSLENDILSVGCEKKSESTEKNEKYTRREFSYSSFNRSFTLPEVVDPEKISARYENGVMIIELPKKEEAKPKGPREISVI